MVPYLREPQPRCSVHAIQPAGEPEDRSGCDGAKISGRASVPGAPANVTSLGPSEMRLCILVRQVESAFAALSGTRVVVEYANDGMFVTQIGTRGPQTVRTQQHGGAADARVGRNMFKK